jgi:hypothetical protein
MQCKSFFDLNNSDFCKEIVEMTGSTYLNECHICLLYIEGTSVCA